jgi:hypothetical protein
MKDLWPNSGYPLLDKTDDGHLLVTDDYLRRYYVRPELALLPGSCPAERALHEALMEAPRRRVAPAEIEALGDADARENYRVMLRFRDRLLDCPTLQSFYASLYPADVAVPPDFLHHIVQMIVRHLLEGEQDGLVARASELFFREQRISVERGMVLSADAETVRVQGSTAGFGSIGRLLREVNAPVRSLELDVLDEDNREEYWERNERFDTVLALNPGRPAAAALARVIERWIAHFHGVSCTVTPIREIGDEEWLWHVGLDAEATATLNAVYRGEAVDTERMKRVIGLFRADFADPGALRPELAGAPVFMALAMRADGCLRMKPQNLLVNLPLARRT